MAGVKGRSGGARPNTGGKRPGAGRKRKAPATAPTVDQVAPASAGGQEGVAAASADDVHGSEPGQDPDAAASLLPRDPLDFLLDVMQGKVSPNSQQMQAAIAAAPYLHSKKEQAGKKIAALAKAKDAAAGGKFGRKQPPRLVHSR